MRTVYDDRRSLQSFIFIFTFILLLPCSQAFDPSSWSHRHMFKRAYGVDRLLPVKAQASSTALQAVTATPPPILSLPPLFPSIPLQPTTTSTTTSPTQQTTSTSATSSTPTTTSTPPPPPPSTSSSTTSSSSSTTSSTTSSSAQTTSVAPAPVVQQASPTAAPTTLVVAPSPVDSSSPDAFTSALPTPSPTPSSSGFFSNTGAVAGTFTVVGLFGVAGVIGVGMLIARRRHSQRQDDDMEFFESKHPDMSVDTSMREDGFHVEDDSMTDEGHYGAPPMVVVNPPSAYYPDRAYPVQVVPPQGYPSEAYASQAYAQGYPAAYARHIYHPEDYNIAYPPEAAHPDSSIPNPHSFTDVELDSTPVTSIQAATNSVPSALRPAVQSTLKPAEQRGDSRFSVDSFYTRMATERSSPAGRAL